MSKLELGLVRANRWALIVILAAMALLVFVNVLLRYLTNQSITWAEEVARHLMIWLTFLGAGPVLRHGGHVALENVQAALPRHLAVLLRATVALLMLAFFLFLLWFGWRYAQRTMVQTTAATGIPFGFVYASMPVGAALLVMHWVFIVRGYVAEGRFPADADADAFTGVLA